MVLFDFWVIKSKVMVTLNVTKIVRNHEFAIIKAMTILQLFIVF
jgi:hypothetical protein